MVTARSPPTNKEPVMWYFLQSLWAWLDGFIYGKVVYVSCDYCPYQLGKKELSTFSDEGKLVETMLNHSCSVKSRSQLAVVSRRFGCWEDTYEISKSLWERG
jgi:hypothetical protein